MTNAIVKQEEVNFEAVLNDIETMQKMCKSLMQTKHYAAMGEVGIFAILQKAKSLGMQPLEALNGGLYFVQGKIGMSTEMMASMIRERGHSIIKDPKSDNSICILHGKRKDTGDTWTVSFSMGDAQKAGLAKNMYDKYPSIMLYNRSMSTLARQLFPDVIKGAGYTLDELHEIKNTNSTNPIENTVVQKISKEQFDALNDMIGEDHIYREKVMKFLDKSLKIKDLEDLPENMYDRVMKGAQKNEQERLLKLQEVACEELIIQEEKKED